MHPDVQTLVHAFAAITIPINWKTEKLPYVNVNIYNVKTNKVGATVRMLVDTGSSSTNIGGQYIKPLGVDLKKTKHPRAALVSLGRQQDAYRHPLKLQIGNLSPIVANVFVRDGPSTDNILGWDVLGKARLEIFGGYNNPTVRYSELATAAMGQAGAYFRSRI